MGYTTEFIGYFTLDAALTKEQASYLNKFSETRRMKRATGSLKDLTDPVREAVGLPIGPDGAYFVGGYGFKGQDLDGTIVDYNQPPDGQPSLCCNWVPVQDDDGEYTYIEWNGVEKFYAYVAWLDYIIEHFLKPWGRVLNGKVKWQGEDRSDFGIIIVDNNVVTIKNGKIVYE